MMQKMAEKCAFEKVPDDSMHAQLVKNFVKIILFLTISETNSFCIIHYTALQDDHQKWWENKFWQNMSADCMYTLRVKNFM